MQPALNDLPTWAQAVAYIIMAGGIGFFGVQKYRKPGQANENQKSEAHLIAAAVFDRLSIDRLSESLRNLNGAIEHDAQARRDAHRDLCEAIEENTDALRRANRLRRGENE